MKLIRPKHINNSYLISSNVTEADYAAWAVGTTYAIGDKVIVISPAATVTMTIASPCVVTWTAHGFATGTIVIFTTTGALPTGITAGQHYYLTVLTVDTFTISSSLLNAFAITTTGTQSGTHTATISSHKIYESLQAGNVGNTPHKSPTYWLDLGNTNRWKMFDQSITSKTTNADSIAVTLQPTGRCDSVALLNIANASSARFRMTDSASDATVTMTIATPCVVTDTAHTKANGNMVRFSTTGALTTGLVADTTYYVINKATNTYELSATSGGASIDTSGTQSGTHTVKTVIYDQTYNLTYTDGIDNWFSYYFEPIIRKRDYVEIDMPSYSSPIIDVWMTGSGTISCGACIIGQKLDVGATQYGARTGIQDYSIKTQDDFGNYNVLERAFSKRADFTIWVNNTRISAVQDILSDYRATPIVYIGEQSLTNTIIYGFYKDFSIDISYPTISICSATIEGLT